MEVDNPYGSTERRTPVNAKNAWFQKTTYTPSDLTKNQRILANKPKEREAETMHLQKMVLKRKTWRKLCQETSLPLPPNMLIHHPNEQPKENQRQSIQSHHRHANTTLHESCSMPTLSCISISSASRLDVAIVSTWSRQDLSWTYEWKACWNIMAAVMGEI